jgi:ACS family D-galactonate transporter-like MFS transporter
LTTASATPSRLSRASSIVLLLLGISVFINYIDRGNLSIAAPTIKNELGLTASQLGFLLSAFFWTYALLQPVCGWLVDRFDVNWVLAGGFFLWSTATAGTGLVHHFAALLAVRLALGVGESVAYPSYSKILARHFPEDQRGRANSVISAGLTCGPAFAMFAGSILMARFGWRVFFVALGLGSLLWLLPWLRWKPSFPSVASESLDAPSLLQFARLRAAWGTCGGLFCGNYISYFFITWMPFYLLRERHFSMNKMGIVAGSSYVAAAISSLVCGGLADRWIARGATPTRVRKTFTGGGMICTAVFLIVCVVSPPGLSIAMLIGVTTSWGASSSNLWAVTQTVAGPAAAGRWTGMQNCIGNLSGIVAPALAGLVLDRTGKFFWPFLIAAAVCIVGACFWIFVLGPVEQVTWGEQMPIGMKPAAADVGLDS